jgi:hypothetical protein
MGVTKIQLEKLGLVDDSHPVRPNRYWCSVIDNHIYIRKDDTMASILQKVSDVSLEKGIEIGKKRRSKQLFDLLNDNDEDDVF